MSDDLRDRIAEALNQWTLDQAAPHRLHPPYLDARTEEAMRTNSLARANAVMAVVQPELDHHIEVEDAALRTLKETERRAERAEAAAARVRRLHTPVASHPVLAFITDRDEQCPACTHDALAPVASPCPTLRALDGTLPDNDYPQEAR